MPSAWSAPYPTPNPIAAVLDLVEASGFGRETLGEVEAVELVGLERAEQDRGIDGID
jgi:hypothetical protein